MLRPLSIHSFNIMEGDTTRDTIKASRWFERHPVLIVVIVLVVALLVIDVSAAYVYRWVKGYPWATRDREKLTEVAPQQYRIPSPIYHHTLKKNVEGAEVQWGPYRYTVSTNSLGFRDKAPRDVPLVSDKYRILFVGDSYTEGQLVSYEDSFVGRIDEALSGSGIEVLNAGVISYSPIVYWKKIEDLLENVGLNVDEVVVFLDISDARDETYSYQLREDGTVGDFQRSVADGSEERREGMLEWIKGLLRAHGIVSFAVLNYLYDITTGNTYETTFRGHFTEADKSMWTVDPVKREEYREGIGRMETYMTELARLLKAHRIPLTIAVYPHPDQIVHNDLDSIYVSIWREWSEENGARFLNYFPYFITGTTAEEHERVLEAYYASHDVHWNRMGHRLGAQIFLEQYKR